MNNAVNALIETLGEHQQKGNFELTECGMTTWRSTQGENIWAYNSDGDLWTEAELLVEGDND